jgi:CheY-like chemotaxis protein
MSRSGGPTPCILVADDQADVREALRLLLKGEGIASETAATPAAALAAAEKRAFDLLLVDLNYARDTTSGAEGLDLLSRLRALDPTLPVVVMTAWGSIDLAVEAMRRGARDFVQKPWDNGGCSPPCGPRSTSPARCAGGSGWRPPTEMLTGRRAFHKDTSVETLNAILKEEPVEFAEDGKVPAALDRLVRHCLEKKPDDRFQQARDLVFELEGLTGSSASTAGNPAGPGVPWRRWLVGGGVPLLALAAAGGFLAGRRTAPSGPLKYQRLTFRRGTVWSARFTPDGQTVVYGAAWEGQPIRTFTTVPGRSEARPLDLPDADVLAISSTGEMAPLSRPSPLLGGRLRQGDAGPCSSRGRSPASAAARGLRRRLVSRRKGAGRHTSNGTPRPEGCMAAARRTLRRLRPGWHDARD